ncbi:MAG: alpha/beta hydrolase [Erythrobacter sp.]|nr:alpha/beta hydrolase [Erythrobacter sp.]
MPLEQVEPIRQALLARRKSPEPPIEQRRAGFEAQMAAVPLPEDFNADEVRISAEAGGLLCRVAGVDHSRILAWLHGGAFVLGSAASYRAMAARLSRAANAQVLLLDYRLAPENPFPAAQDDARAMLGWIEAEGFEPERSFVGGDSAGANLALGAVQHVMAQGGKAPIAALWLISPYLDLTHSGDSIKNRAARDPFVDPAGMPETAARYLAGADPGDPRASPLFGSFEGLPPALIQIGADEVLFSDAARARKAIEAAGGRCVFQEWAGMVHVWPLFAHQVDEGGWAIEQGGAFLRSL